MHPLFAALLVGFAVISVILTVIDLREHRLPNAVVLPAIVVTVLVLAVASATAATWLTFGRAVLSGAVLYVVFLGLRWASGHALGGGDVKLSALIGLLLGWQGWSTVMIGMMAAFLLAGLVAIALMIARKAGSQTAIAFGPYLLLGAWVGILTSILAT